MLTNTAYIKTEDLNAILFPKRSDGYTQELKVFPEPRESYIENIFGGRIMFFGDNFSEGDDISNIYTPIEVRAIICDSNRTCMYLVYNERCAGIQLPGGSIYREDFDNVYMDEESTLLTSLMRNILTQLDPIYGESTYNSIKDEYLSIRTKFTHVLYSKFGHCVEQPELYFSYIFPNTSKRKFVVYYVYECDFIKGTNGIGLLPRGVFSLNKDLFRISLKHDRITTSNVVGFDYIHRGVIFEEYGKAQLNAIFNTNKLF